MGDIMIRVLFVDDDPQLLEAFRRLLRRQRCEWDISFVGSGAEALTELANGPYDAVVTDMLMPLMDGAQLLTEVSVQFPKVARVILSGQCDSIAGIRSAGPAHRFLAKPCQMEELMAAVGSVCAICKAVNESFAGELISHLQSIPSSPELLTRLLEQFQKPDVSINEVSELISEDVGMVAKILQLVNSSFFGLSNRVSNPQQAASMLGLDTLQGLAVSTSVFTAFPTRSAKAIDFDKFQEHSLQVSQAAKTIALAEAADENTVNDALLAGMMHDVGKVILASEEPQTYCSIIDEARKSDRQSFEVETERLSLDHGQLGAFAMALWGIPGPVVDAIAFHHKPHSIHQREGLPLGLIVHAADTITHELTCTDETSHLVPELDGEALEQFGFEHRVDHWREAIAKNPQFAERRKSFA
ncbi:MAG: HD-like signal output (HDOD) protein [Pirellulaceae bacterium]|jgi:HD-like signal output (HDOD) protein